MCLEYALDLTLSLHSRSYLVENARAFFSTWLFKQGYFSQDSLNLPFFSFSFGVRVCLVSVSVDNVRDVINVSSAEVPNSKVLKMVKRAEVTRA